MTSLRDVARRDAHEAAADAAWEASREPAPLPPWTPRPFAPGPWKPWMGPSVTIFEAMTSDAKRAERDRQLAAWCGLDDPGPFLRRRAASEAWRAVAEREAVIHRLAEVEDTHAGLLVRIDAVIADLDSWRGA